MAKLFETSEDIVELAENKFEETGLAQIGINLRIMSVPKAKDILKISRANATTEYLTNSDDLITLFVFEQAFDRLSDEQKNLLMEGVFSNVAYDTEKDKLIVDNSRYGEFIRMRRKYENYGDIIEVSTMVIEEIAEEEKRRKEEEKLAKKELKNKSK